MPERSNLVAQQVVDSRREPVENPSSVRGLTYAQSGVDMEAGDRVVDLIKPALRRTHGPRVMGAYGGFGAMFRLDFKERRRRR